MQQAEIQPRPIQIMKQVANHFTERRRYASLQGNPLLTREDKEQLIAHDKLMRQKGKEDLAQRRAKEAEAERNQKPIVVDGKTYTNLGDGFLAYVLQQNRLEREALARGEEYKLPPLSLRPIDRVPLTPEQQKQRQIQQDQKIVRDADYQLSKEVNAAHFDKIAEAIQKKVWRGTSKGLGSVTIKPYHQIDMSITNNGSVINRSKSGTTIGNAHDALSFGIGYFTDRAYIIDEAQGLLSDDEVAKGVKANFIQHTYTVEEEGKRVEKTEMIIIPHAYAENVGLFCAFLHSAAIVISPDEHTTQIRKAIQLETRKAPILRRASALAA